MIRSIQVETKNAVTAMEAGTKEVELGVESTTMAGSALKEIISTNERVSDMITHIATAATEQSAATEQIHGSIDQIAKITSRSVLSMQQTNNALDDLSALATNLQQLVGHFRLRANGHQARGETDSGGVKDEIRRSIDFARVKMAHRGWRLRLRRFLDGSEDIDGKQLGSHRDCELGKWIYAEGLPNYGNLQDVRDLEQKHKDMHALVKEVVQLKHAGNIAEAEREFAAVSASAEAVVALLDSVERQLGSSPRAMAMASA